MYSEIKPLSSFQNFFSEENIDTLPKFGADDTSGNGNDDLYLKEIGNIINPKSPCVRGKNLFSD